MGLAAALLGQPHACSRASAAIQPSGLPRDGEGWECSLLLAFTIWFIGINGFLLQHQVKCCWTIKRWRGAGYLCSQAAGMLRDAGWATDCSSSSAMTWIKHHWGLACVFLSWRVALRDYRHTKLEVMETGGRDSTIWPSLSRVGPGDPQRFPPASTILCDVALPGGKISVSFSPSRVG